jgi:hypothetical protein
MATARRRLLDPGRSTWVHCTSRCVRKAYLCGGRDGRWEHRRGWLEERLGVLAKLFAVEVAGYAVMSNHFHLVLRMVPEAPAGWTDLEVARRWLSVYPRSYLKDGTPVLPAEPLIARQAQDASWVAERRKHLGNLGWFMKALKEGIARRANREDSCSGAFWEERFHSVPLLDQAALIAAMAYVDLNPVRAKLADRPERAEYTAGRARIAARQRHAAAERIRQRQPSGAEQLLRNAGPARGAAHAEDGLWLCPLSRCIVGEEAANRRITADDYLQLLDATGRLLRAGKRGAIPPGLAPILSRLELPLEGWLATMLGWRMFACSSALGRAAALAAEQTRRGVAWLRCRCPLFAERAA